MATYRDAALAAYQQRDAAWVQSGKQRLAPLMTDSTGKVVLDPLSKTEEAGRDSATGLLVLHTTDGSDLYFAVYPDKADEPVRMVEPDGSGGFTGYGGTGLDGPKVADLDDVGAVLAGAA